MPQPTGAGGAYPPQDTYGGAKRQGYPPNVPVPPGYGPPPGYGYAGQVPFTNVLQNLTDSKYLKILIPRLLAGVSIALVLGLVLSMLMLGIGLDTGFQQLVNTLPGEVGYLITSSMTFMYVSHGIGLVPSLEGQPIIPALEYLPMVFIPAIALILGGMITSWLMRTKNIEESMVTGLFMALPYMLFMAVISIFVRLPIPTVDGLWYNIDIITLVIFTMLWGFMFGSLGGLLKGLLFR